MSGWTQPQWGYPPAAAAAAHAAAPAAPVAPVAPAAPGPLPAAAPAPVAPAPVAPAAPVVVAPPYPGGWSKPQKPAKNVKIYLTIPLGISSKECDNPGCRKKTLFFAGVGGLCAWLTRTPAFLQRHPGS